MPNYDLGTASGKIEVDTSNLQKAQLAFSGFGNAMLGMGTLALAGFGAAAGAAANFEKQIDLFGAVSGATKEQLDAVSARALKLGQDTIFSAGQVAGAIAEMSKAGVTTEDILAGAADAAVHLAAATDTDLTTAVDIATAAMNTFNLTGGQLEGVVDAIARVANSSSISVEDIGTSLKYAGGPAHALGLSIDETTTAIGLLGKAGIAGSTAGTSLRRILLNLSPASKEAAAEMQKLGIITADGSNQFYDSAGNAKSLKDIMEVLHGATKNLTAEQKVQALNTIFGNRAVSSAILLADQGAAGYDAFAASVAAQGSASEISSKRLDNLSGDIEILKGNIETMLVQAGSPFQEWLRGIVQGITKAIASFAALSPETQKNILNFILYTGVLLVAMGTIAKIIGVVLNFIQKVAQLAKGIEYVLKVTGVWRLAIEPLLLQLSLLPTRIGLLMLRLGGLRGILTLLFKPIGLIVRGLIFLGTALVSLVGAPVLIVIAVIAALAAAFVLAYKYIKPFHDAVDSLWQLIQKAFHAFVDFAKAVGSDIVDGFKKAGSAIADFYQSFLNGIDAVGNFIGKIIDWFQALPGHIADGFHAVIDFFTGLPGMVADAGSRFLSAAGDFLSQLPGQIAYWLGFAIGRYIRFWIDAITLVITYGALIIGAVIGFMTRLPGIIWDALVAAYNFMVTFVTNFVTAAIDLGTRVLSTIIAFFTQLPGTIWNFLTAAYNFMVQFVTDMINKAIEVGTRFIQTIVSFFTQLPGQIAGFLSSVYNSVSGWTVNMAGKARDVGTQFLNTIVSFFSQLPGKIADFIGQVISKVTGFAADMAGKAADAGRKFVSGLSDAIAAAPGVVGKIVDNMIQTVKDAANRAYTAVKGLGDKMWQGFKDGIGIHSPSFIEKATTALVKNVNQDIETLKKQVGTMQNLGNALPDVAAQMDVNLAATGTGGSGGGDTNISMEFNGVSAEDIPKIKDAMSSSNVLVKLTQAAKAGRR